MRLIWLYQHGFDCVGLFGQGGAQFGQFGPQRFAGGFRVGLIGIGVDAFDLVFQRAGVVGYLQVGADNGLLLFRAEAGRGTASQVLQLAADRVEFPGGQVEAIAGRGGFQAAIQAVGRGLPVGRQNLHEDEGDDQQSEPGPAGRTALG